MYMFINVIFVNVRCLYLCILKGTEICTNISMYNDMLGDNIAAKILPRIGL